MADSGETKTDVQKTGSLTQIDLAQPETDPQETASLKHIAESCERHLHRLLQDEEAQDGIMKAKEGHWASRQYAEFNLWCAKVGVHGEGLRSIDVRLKDVPEICTLLRRLLQSLERDLDELEQSAEPCTQIISTDDDNDDEDDAESDASSLSFEALSSAENSEAGSTPESPAPSLRKQNLVLQAHIEDTIERLHGHALRIEDAGASHRRRRVELYRQKEGPKGTYEGFKALALHKAKLQFKKASEPFLERLAESFARRRIRLEYLREHQKKRTVDTPKPEPSPAPKSQVEPEVQVVEEKKAPESKRHVTAPSRPQDQRTVYSATVRTKLDLHPQPKRPEKAESVASIALRNPGFPPPPRCTDARFQCPYCRLEFRSREAEKDRWSQHVMQDFEPYFCIWAGCNAPFEVPNTFEGLLSHLQSHVDVQYHVDMPDGEHKTFDEEEFEGHVAQHGHASDEMLTAMKEASRRRAAFIFEDCPFCGGFPDNVEKRFPDRDTAECQRELRRHIKQHMQDVALFLPPFREDILDEAEDLKSSVVSRRRSTGLSSVGDPSELVDRCLREDCDCKRSSSCDDLLGPIPVEPPTDDTLWAETFPGLPRYDRSPVQDDYYLGEEKLQPFIARAQGEMQPPASQSAPSSSGRHGKSHGNHPSFKSSETTGIEVIGSQGEKLGEIYRLDIDNPFVNRALQLPTKRHIHLRPGRSMSAESLSGIYAPSAPSEKAAKGDAQPKGAKWLSCMIQAKGDVYSHPCTTCADRIGVFHDCVKIGEQKGNGLFPRCGNCEWNRRGCHGAASMVQDPAAPATAAGSAGNGADHPDTLTSMDNLAATLWNQHRWEEAEKLQVQVVETRKTKFGADHPDTLRSMDNLAATLRSQGRWEEAEKLEVQVMETTKTKFGADHPDTLTSMDNLAATLWSQGRWEEAEKLEVQLMETTKTKFGADHPDTLMSMDNLAATLRSQGRWEEAEKLQVQVMETTKTKLGADHPDTLTSMGNLAATLWSQGRWEEAEKLQVQVMKTTKTKLGADHPDTLTSMGNLAATLWSQHRWEEAEKLQVQVVETRKTKFGADHPDTLTSMGNLTGTLRSQGRWEEAEKLQVQVMETTKTKLGADHPDTLRSIGNLVATLRSQGRWEEAEKLEVQVMETTKTKLGADHPDTLRSMGNLAATLRSQGRWEEAEKLQVQVMETTKTKLGADHPDTLRSMGNLAATLRSQGRWEEAEKLQVQVIETTKTKLGADHPDTLRRMGNLAATLRSQGRWEEAEKLQVQVMETTKTKLGADYPDTLTSMGELAFTWKGQGRHADALVLMKDCAQAQERILGPKHPDTLQSLATTAQWSS